MKILNSLKQKGNFCLFYFWKGKKFLSPRASFKKEHRRETGENRDEDQPFELSRGTNPTVVPHKKKNLSLI